MNNNSHPDTDSLLGFLDDPADTEYSGLSLHLARCEKCRHEVAALSSLTQQLIRHKRSRSGGDDAPRQQMDKLKRMLDANVDPQQRNEFTKELENDKDLLRSALHFATHSEEMNTGLTAEKLQIDNAAAIRSNLNQKEANQHAPSTLLNIFTQHCMSYFHWRPPLWSAAAVAACLLISIAINLQFITTTQSDFDIIAYQDSPILTFTSQQDDNPGIGFFSNITSSTETFTGIQITRRDNNTLAINWPKVDKATEYTIRLEQISHEGRLLLAEQQTTSNSAEFSKLPLQSLFGNTRFEWSLFGVTIDKKAFRARGGFVMRNSQ